MVPGLLDALPFRGLFRGLPGEAPPLPDDARSPARLPSPRARRRGRRRGAPRVRDRCSGRKEREIWGAHPPGNSSMRGSLLHSVKDMNALPVLLVTLGAATASELEETGRSHPYNMERAGAGGVFF